MTSFPVPLSPVMKTETFTLAKHKARSSILHIDRLALMKGCFGSDSVIGAPRWPPTSEASFALEVPFARKHLDLKRLRQPKMGVLVLPKPQIGPAEGPSYCNSSPKWVPL